jgi:signal transduction histidine kinase
MALFGAGASWVATGLAPLWQGAVPDSVLRVSLLPTALLVIAAELVDPRQHAWRRAVVVSGAFLIVFAGVVGVNEWAMVGFGGLLLFEVDRDAGPSFWHRRRWRRRGSPAFAIGVGLVAVGVSAQWAIVTPAFVANLHQLVLVVGGIAVAWAGAAVDDGMTAGDPVIGALAQALSDAIGDDLAIVAFPSTLGSVDRPSSRWIDPLGMPCQRSGDGATIVDSDGTLVAWLAPSPRDERHADDLVRVLRLAGDVARLRAQLRERADDIERSTERLATAAERERARLALMLESGPIATLHEVAMLLALPPAHPELLERLASAERVLRNVVVGIDPFEGGRALAMAIGDLATRFGAERSIDIVDEVAPDVARLVWFTCAEALVNAVKHAPGAARSVSLVARRGGVELVVADEGDGGADGTSMGLRGLVQRASHLDATLHIDSPPGRGTTVTLSVPSSTYSSPLQYEPARMPAAPNEQMMPT